MNQRRNNNMDVAPEGDGKPTPHSLMEVPGEIEDFMQQLTSDRLIKIIIGEGGGHRQYLVQETVLTASSEYFKKALKHEQSMGKQPGVLYFPDDGDFIAAWGVVLHWILHKQLLPKDVDSDELAIWVAAWVLGDKYLLPKLQNKIMERLYEFFSKTHIATSDVQLVSYILSITPADSPIRRLLAEEAVYVMYSDHYDPNGRMRPSQLVEMARATDIIESLMNAWRAFTRDPDIHLRMNRQGYKQEYRGFLVQED